MLPQQIASLSEHCTICSTFNAIETDNRLLPIDLVDDDNGSVFSTTDSLTYSYDTSLSSQTEMQEGERTVPEGNL